MHGQQLTEIAIVVFASLACGIALTRLRQPALVGYILAGCILGPSGFGFVTNRESVSLLAELGVLMLLFLIGMELSLRAFKRVWRVALAGALMQIALALSVMWLLGLLFEWSGPLVVLLGFAVAISSTAVAIKILDDVGELRSDVGRVAVGVLIAQDLAVVPMLLIVSAMGGETADILGASATILAALGFLAGLVFILSQRQSLKLPLADWITTQVDLTATAGLAVCFAAAALSGVLGLSPAYGAFLAGLIVGNTRERPNMIAATEPIQAILLMVFFLSIGLLIDLRFIWENIGTVVLLLIVVTVVKTAANVGILRLLGEPWPRAFQAGTVLGQIGEFSFVLMAAGVAVGVIDGDGNRLMVAIIALSLVISPLWLITARRLHNVAWRRISTFRQLWAQVYGRETTAVVSVSERAMSNTMRFTISVSEQSAEALHKIFKAEGGAETSEDSSDPARKRDGRRDASFSDSRPPADEDKARDA